MLFPVETIDLHSGILSNQMSRGNISWQPGDPILNVCKIEERD